ncbi:MAG: acyltransferase family protein [Aureispira sp.]
MSNRPYIPIIESLRGCAASAVCCYHFVWGTVNYIEAPWARNLSYWGQYGVTLFFVLSGLVLPLALLRYQYQITHFFTFIKKRIWRLEPPYLCSIIITIIYLALQAWRHQHPLEFSWLNISLHIGYLIPFFEEEAWLNPVYWSLAVEFQYYCLLGLIFPIWTSPHLILRCSCYIFLLGLSLVSNQKDLVFRWLPLFLISGNYILYQQKYLSKIEFRGIFIVCLLFLNYLLTIEHSIVVVSTLLLVHFFPFFNPKWLAWLGRCSYGLYLLHWTVGQALINVLSHHYRLPYEKVLVLLIGYGVSVLTASFFYYWIEKPSKIKAHQIRMSSIDN